MGVGPQRDDHGQGLIPTLAGFTVVLVLVLFASQVLFALYARSAVTAAAVDAARSVADYGRAASYRGTPAGGPDPAEQAAIDQARQRFDEALGAYGSQTRFDLSLEPTDGEPQQVVLHVGFDLRASRFSLVGPLILPGLNRFDRTVRVRIERIVCPSGRTCTVVPRGSDADTTTTTLAEDLSTTSAGTLATAPARTLATAPGGNKADSQGGGAP